MTNKCGRILVVGAGFAGATAANILASNGFKVTVIDRRPHVAGNAYDYTSALGIRIHKYGPHIFHTSNFTVVDYLSQFTDWIEYKHKVKAILSDGQLVDMPPNVSTVEVIGEDNIVEVLFRPYTKKMWGLEIEQIDPSIINRVAIKSNNCDLYFPNDTFQAMPKLGYTEMIRRMLDHENIDVHLECEFEKSMENEFIHVFNSMPIDEYHNFTHGHLPYRSIKFHNYELPTPSLGCVPTINLTNNSKYTRYTEWKNYPGHGFNDAWTVVTWEEPCDYLDNDMERYYPVKDILGQNRGIYKKYSEMTCRNVTFIGRCGLYVYLDMHQAVSSTMATITRFLKSCDR